MTLDLDKLEAQIKAHQADLEAFDKILGMFWKKKALQGGNRDFHNLCSVALQLIEALREKGWKKITETRFYEPKAIEKKRYKP